MLSAAWSSSLSIIIPSHRRTDLLRLCLQSVTRHAPPDVEVIVVDDGSTGAAISRTALSFPDVRIVRLSRPRGFCFAANRGIETSRGSIVHLLNDDTQVSAGWVSSALSCFADPAVGAVAPLVLQGQPGVTDPTIDSAGDGYDSGGFAWKIGHKKRLSGFFLQKCSVAAASGSSAFLRRSALEHTGLFPEHFGAYFEDVDLSLRLAAVGFKICFEPASRVWHQGGSSYGRRSWRLVERQSRNEEWLFWRNLDRRRPWSTIFRHIAVLGGKAARRLREGTFIPFATGRLRAGVRLWQAVLKKDDRSCPILPKLGPC